MARPFRNQLLLTSLLLAAATVGCLAPPEGSPVQFSVGPVFDLGQLEVRPSGSVVRIRSGILADSLDGSFSLAQPCPFFEVSVRGIVDRDSSRILFRLIANNQSSDPTTPPTVIVDTEARRDPEDPEEPFSFFLPVVPLASFGEQVRRAAFSDGVGLAASLTLIATDAPRFEFDADDVPAGNDFAAVAAGDHSVAGFVWPLSFERGACDGVIQ
ncbi:MAG: hypothetical protein HC923_10480 [Myxococcales bacterium]|nr:hypothetical protein [Myxococcales bacterium]